MQKSILSVTGVVILGAILLFLNSISDNLFSRFYVDLTEEGLYSLSKGTSNIIESVKDPITLRFYFSKTDGSKYPAVKLYGTRVEDLLKEYQRQSKGKISLEIYDPRPDTEEEEWAQKYGLRAMKLPTGENLFFGLAGIDSAGREEVIPVFEINRQQFLEYDITKLLYSLTREKKPLVGIISSLDIQGAPAQPSMPGMPPRPGRPWILVNQLSRVAEIKFLEADTDSIPDGIDVLMVIHPKSLPEQTRYAIDQFAVSGGNLFIAVDPYCASDIPKNDPSNPMAAMMANRGSQLNDITGAWGVTLADKKIVADINLATKVSAGRGQSPQSFPLWITLRNMPSEDIINHSQVITSELENVMVAWSGALKLSKVKGVFLEPLFKTTKEAMLFEDRDIRFGGDKPEQILKKYRRGNEAQVIGVKVTGQLKSAFKKKPGAEEAEATNMSVKGGHISEGTKGANVIIMADVDFLSDQYCAYSQNFLGTQIVSLINDNLIFAANAIENLTGSNDLISLRSRGKFTRPFTKVQEIEARAHEKWKSQEMLLEAKLNQANQRLSQLQSGAQGGKGKKVFTKALLDEIREFREERKTAQQRLREVRKNLREDKERLGTLLFALNTFLVPIVLIVLSGIGYSLRRKRLRNNGANEQHGEETKA